MMEVKVVVVVVEVLLVLHGGGDVDDDIVTIKIPLIQHREDNRNRI
jgi:hypothetical protein